jgi:hypothetical protein
MSERATSEQAQPPTESGWYWVEDFEVCEGSAWRLAFVNVLGDEYSEGLPMMTMFNREAKLGMPLSWEFFLDGGEWLCPDNPHAATWPLKFVPVQCPGEPI